MMSKLVFQFRKNDYKKTCNILKNGFTKSILKNTKKKYTFLKLKQTDLICSFDELLTTSMSSIHCFPPKKVFEMPKFIVYSVKKKKLNHQSTSFVVRVEILLKFSFLSF